MRKRKTLNALTLIAGTKSSVQWRTSTHLSPGIRTVTPYLTFARFDLLTCLLPGYPLPHFQTPTLSCANTPSRLPLTAWAAQAGCNKGWGPRFGQYFKVF